MTRPPSGQGPPANYQVNQTNSTLNHLMPGRLKSWMTNSAPSAMPGSRHSHPLPIQPLRRPSGQSRIPAQPQSAQPAQAERQPQEPEQDEDRFALRQPQPAPSTPANVLPSPAPSDEPSPAALSNYKDSPNPQTISLAIGPRGHQSPANVAAASDPVTSIDPSMLTNSNPSRPETEGAEASSLVEQAVYGLLSHAVQSPRVMPPPNLPSANQPTQLWDAEAVSDPSLRRGSLEAQPRPGSSRPEDHRDKRRRVENTVSSNQPPITNAQLARLIDRYVAQIGGEEQLSVDIERPRLQLLRDACLQRDLFYLQLHSLYCLWSLEPGRLPGLHGYNLEDIHTGFRIVATVIKSNDGFSRKNLEWCAKFPTHRIHEEYPQGVRMVADFLTGLSKHWPVLAPEVHNRHYPYLVDELLGKLHCYSPCMQNILFTACRRRLGISDGPLSDRANALFKQDQQAHVDENGAFRPVVLSDDADRLKYQNAQLIQRYQKIVGEAKQQQDEQLEQRRQTDQRQQARQQAQQQAQNWQAQQSQQMQGQRGQQPPFQAVSIQRVLSVQQQQQQQLLQQQQQQQPYQQPRLDQYQQLHQQAFMQQMQMPGNVGLGFQQQQQQAQLQQPMQLSVNTNFQQVPQALHTPQQSNFNAQWALGQGQGPTLAANQNRNSFSTNQQSPHSSTQFAARPQTSGASSGFGNFQVGLGPYPNSPQAQQFPADLVLGSNLATSPTVSGQPMGAQTHSRQLSNPQQYQYNQPQLQTQLQNGQNQSQMQYTAQGPTQWPVVPSQTYVTNAQMSPPVNPSASPQMQVAGQQQYGSRPQSRAGAAAQMVHSSVIRQQMTQQQLQSLPRPSQQPFMGQQLISQHQISQQPMGQQPMGQQPMGQQQMAQQQMGFQHLAHQRMGQQMMQSQPQLQLDNVHRPIVPPKGHIIDRSEYPHTHQEKKSLLMSLHQAKARSPDRTRRNGDSKERFYQSVQSFALPPFRLVYYHDISLEVTPEQHSELYKMKTLSNLTGSQTETQRPSPVREYGNGSLRFRARCCRLPSDKQAGEANWVTQDVLFPKHIFAEFNGHKLSIRRATHNGKDMPIELTDYVVPGTNRLRVTVPRTVAAEQPNFYMAIEVIGVSSHAILLRDIEANQRVGRQETLEKIRSRVNAVSDEDEIVVVDRTGSTAHDLSISLTDPFSASIFEIPVRGAACTHMECFDLETWLNTRPAKQQIKCGHSRECCTCPKRLEPSEPDKWKCPICSGDARPNSLRIDSFLEDVRRELAARGKLTVKSILAAADGTWRAVDEPDDDDDEDSDTAGPVTRRSISALRRVEGPSKSASVERARAPPVEVIELD